MTENDLYLDWMCCYQLFGIAGWLPALPDNQIYFPTFNHGKIIEWTAMLQAPASVNTHRNTQRKWNKKKYEMQTIACVSYWTPHGPTVIHWNSIALPLKFKSSWGWIFLRKQTPNRWKSSDKNESNEIESNFTFQWLSNSSEINQKSTKIDHKMTENDWKFDLSLAWKLIGNWSEINQKLTQNWLIISPLIGFQIDQKSTKNGLKIDHKMTKNDWKFDIPFASNLIRNQRKFD